MFKEIDHANALLQALQRQRNEAFDRLAQAEAENAVRIAEAAKVLKPEEAPE